MQGGLIPAFDNIREPSLEVDANNIGSFCLFPSGG